MAKFRILLLTNRDSDNVGDQIIEGSVLSIIKGIMSNLGLTPDEYSINSRAAGIVNKKFLKTGDPKLLEDAKKAISNADLIIFGGAPLFNYKYQSFYRRTITTLELANEYNVPVIFSSIGVESYDPDNPKSQALKAALELPCVRQITTRDDLESLRKYTESTDIPVARVADPAVLADIVYRDVATPRTLPAVGRAKTIGLVVTRAGIFADNGISWNESKQRRFWLDIIAQLTERGYDYRLFTTGHFSDEVFLDALFRKMKIPARNVVFTVNTPDELVQELNECDGVIAFRLHASITSFAYSVPSIGLSWNFKVPYFYDSIGYSERAVPPEQWNAEAVIPALERAMVSGIDRDEEFLTSVYNTLFEGIKSVIAPDSSFEPYSYEQLKTKLPPHPATTAAQYKLRSQIKFRRTYENYQRYYRYYLAAERRKLEQVSLRRRLSQSVIGLSYRRVRRLFRKLFA